MFCISSQQSLHIRRVASDHSVVMYVYVGIVGWIYRTKIDPISIPDYSSSHSQYLAVKEMGGAGPQPYELIVPEMPLASHFISDQELCI